MRSHATPDPSEDGFELCHRRAVVCRARRADLPDAVGRLVHPDRVDALVWALTELMIEGEERRLLIA